MGFPVHSRAGSPARGLRRADVADGALALAVAVFGQIDLRFNIDASTHYGSGRITAFVILVAGLALAFRRAAPTSTACLVAAVIAVPELFTVLTITLWGHFVPLLVVAYSAARHAPRRGAILGCAAVGAAVATVWLRVPATGTTENIPFAVIPYVLAVAAGRVLRARARRHAATEMEARRLSAERDEAVRAAIAEERGRIARELHDIVAHCVSVMVVQAGAAEDLLGRDPERAYEPLRAVQETGGQAVAELGRMLGLLRAGDEPGPRSGSPERRPQPGIGDLGDLVAHLKTAGLPVALSVSGTPRAVPPGVGLTVYRVAQEALTNVLKHAGPSASARVCLTYGEESVQVSVRDDGRGSGAGHRSGGAEDAAGAASTGHGLIGMRERAALYGGTLTAGTEPGGGFAVSLTLPARAPAGSVT